MKFKRIGILVAVAAVLAVITGGMASAAIVPFTGTESSQFYGDNTAGYTSEINQQISVRNGDSMQFQNKWYNTHVGATVDCRIVYGGGQPNVCTGADTTIYTGLTYLSYYPSSGTVSQYSTVVAGSGGPYNLVPNHKYVYNGQTYGTGGTWTMTFQL